MRQWDSDRAERSSTPADAVPADAAGLRRPSGCRRVGGLDARPHPADPGRDLGRSGSPATAPRLLLAGNAGHADIPLDAPGSGLIGLLLTMLGQTVGFPVPEGGAGQLTAALAGGWRASAADPVTPAPRSSGSMVHRGRAIGVRSAGGQPVRRTPGRAGRRVGAEQLYGGLVDDRDVPARPSRGDDGLPLDPATVKID